MRNQSVFMQKFMPSEHLSKIVGDQPITRVNVVQLVWNYIKNRKLQDPVQRRNINTDVLLARVCGDRAVISMFDLAKYLTRHLQTIPKPMKKALKFNVGDKVTITGNSSNHGFSIGDTVEICKVATAMGCYNARNAKASWYISEKDCKLANSKTPKTQPMANTNVTSTVKALVLGCAQTLLRANNTVTTLEIKLELRKTQPAYYWTQQIVSDIMDEFAKANVFTYSDNGTFRTYSDPSRTVKTKRVAKSTKTATKVAKSASIGKTFTATGTISRSKALKMIRNNKGHFFTVVFTKKEDGSTRTMNCQYLSGQTVDKNYVKVREASLIRTNDPNPIRQFATANMKMLSIAGNCYKVK